MKKKIKKTKQVHHGDPVYKDESGRMFVELGNTRVYFNRKTIAKIEARKKKKKSQNTGLYASLRR